MRIRSREDGFTLVELLTSTTITLIVLGTAMTTFKQTLAVHETASLLSDSSQNLRAGTNLLVRDLLEAGRGMPTGGVAIPSGGGAGAINRPSPTGQAYVFDNVNANTLPSIISGAALGPNVDGLRTDLITILMADTTLEVTGIPTQYTLDLNPQPAPANPPLLDPSGASFTVGWNTLWLTGDTARGVNKIKAGDLICFMNNATGGSAIQTVTRTDATTVYFDAGDWFNFNQRAAGQGSITQLKNGGVFPQTKAFRVNMLTYYVDNTTTAGVPRLVRMINHLPPQSLAGVVEDLDISYDLVDGVTNPINIKSLPFTSGAGVTYTANQIRKVNLHVGVRSSSRSTDRHDFLRNHMTTVVSIRGLAFSDRYK
jgi:Tfp pilus assembly protein PilW